MIRLIEFLQQLIKFYEIIIFINVILSWLFASGTLRKTDPRLREVVQVLNGLTEPLLRRLRPWLPNTGALDLAPMALWFLCVFVDQVVLGNLADLFR